MGSEVWFASGRTDMLPSFMWGCDSINFNNGIWALFGIPLLVVLHAQWRCYCCSRRSRQSRHHHAGEDGNEDGGDNDDDGVSAWK